MANFNNPLKDILSTMNSGAQIENIENAVRANQERVAREERRNVRIEQRQQQQLDVAEKTRMYTKWILWLTITIAVITVISLAVALW